MAAFGSAAAQSRVASTPSTSTIRSSSSASTSARAPIFASTVRRGNRRGSHNNKSSLVSLTTASATPSTGGTGGGGTRASRRRERRALQSLQSGGAGNGVANGVTDGVTGVSGDQTETSNTPNGAASTQTKTILPPAVTVVTDTQGDEQRANDETRPLEQTLGETKTSRQTAPSSLPVETNRTVHLGATATAPEALRKIRLGLRDLVRDYSLGTVPPFTSGVVRFTVAVPRHIDALNWLRSVDTSSNVSLLPAYYLSPRTPPPAVRSGDGDNSEDDEDAYSSIGGGSRVDSSHGKKSKNQNESKVVAEPSSWRADPRGAVAAVGGAVVWTGPDAFESHTLKHVRRFLSKDVPHDSAPRVYGAGRFDPASSPSQEWKRFGGHYFFLPTIEVVEGARCGTVACAVVWDAQMDGIDTFRGTDNHNSASSSSVSGSKDLAAAVAVAADAIDAALGENRSMGIQSGKKQPTVVPHGSATLVTKTLEPDQQGWSTVVDGLLRALRESGDGNDDANERTERVLGTETDSEALKESSTSSTTEYVWDELDGYGSDSYIDDFASGDGYGGGYVNSGVRSVREKLLDLGKAAGVEAPPPNVMKELEAFATAAGLGADINQSSWVNTRKKIFVDRDVGDAGSVGIGWSVDESFDEGNSEGDTYKATTDALLKTETTTSDASSQMTTTPLRKVVLARRSTLTFTEPVDALGLVASLRSRDPEAYQFALVHADGAAFVGSTPERLFSCRDNAVASEAVAGTRPRGSDEGEDAALAYEMLLSPKEHTEFAIVREEVRKALATVSKDGADGVRAELEKGVLRHVSVQHLYARLGCELNEGTTEAEVLSALHPTPAVCGHPRKAALNAIRNNETFDRGLYAGPLGWIASDSVEFCVAIRSALIETDSHTNTSDYVVSSDSHTDDTTDQPTESHQSQTGSDTKTTMRLYAGVGVVAAADPTAEWNELNLKTKPLETLLGSLEDGHMGKHSDDKVKTVPIEVLPKVTDPKGTKLNAHKHSSLASAPNPNHAWATLIIGELWRDGISVFCIAPGSRSTPLALAAERHPCARVVVCVDERSLAFYALGVGKGAGSNSAGACVITSSGTAVANLLPAAVEASESNSPLLLLTADRPPELRDTGANQTIDQVKIFGGFARYSVDLAPPGDGAPARVWATAANAATRHLKGNKKGPVHVNCQFRDPLGPVPCAWNPERDLRGLEGWEARTEPFSGSGKTSRSSAATYADVNAIQSLVSLIKSAKKGVLVVAGGASDGAASALAAADIASTLGWAVVADAASGIRVGGVGSDNSQTDSSHTNWSPATSTCPNVLNAMDVSLCSSEMRDFFKPDVIVQLNPRLTSKRVQTALELSALDHDSTWAVCTTQETRTDPGHCVSLHVTADVSQVAATMRRALEDDTYSDSSNAASCFAFRDILKAADAAASREALSVLHDLEQGSGITEMGTALLISNNLPQNTGLFLGNSMPIRDVDALAGVKGLGGLGGLGNKSSNNNTSIGFGPGAPVCANRGASGIDGVVSAAAGYAAGLQRPVTLLIGDVSFQHDANGLLLLRERPGQPPVTIVVVNNGGGGIFSFLPNLSDKIDSGTYTKLFATPPDVSRRGLCDAHRVAHAHPSTPAALKTALEAAWSEGRHSVVEVTTSRAQNLRQHRVLQNAVAKVVDASLKLSLGGGDSVSDNRRVVASADVRKFELPMLKEPTTVIDGAISQTNKSDQRQTSNTSSSNSTRTGYLLEVTFACGAVGRGEASPLPGLNSETSDEAGAQLTVIANLLKDVNVPKTLPVLNGAFEDFLVNEVGVRDLNSLLPSVRFAVESAVLQALSNGTGDNKCHQKSVSETLLLGASRDVSSSCASSTFVESNALIESKPEDTPESAAADALRLVNQGYRCIKIKVARGVGSAGATKDADRVEAIRNAVGPDITLRCDANQRWNLNEALTFGLRAVIFDLQYIEEPVGDVENDLAAFHCTTGVPVALDESVDAAMRRRVEKSSSENGSDASSKEILSVSQTLEALFEPTFGVVALVLKPSVLGGYETCGLIAKAARQKGIDCVVTSAFESGVGVANCAHLAAALDNAAEECAKEAMESSQIDNAYEDDGEDSSDDLNPQAGLKRMQHGLGTGAWLDGDVTEKVSAPMTSSRKHETNRGVGISLARKELLEPFRPDVVSDTIMSDDRHWGSVSWKEVETEVGVYRFKVVDSREEKNDKNRKAAFFLHGFMGGAEDWGVVVGGLVLCGVRCVAADLPGHGGTEFEPAPGYSLSDGVSIEAVSHAIEKLGESLFDAKKISVTLIGYSLGARVGLKCVADGVDWLKGGGFVSIGGSPGISETSSDRVDRLNRDHALATALRESGVKAFANSWYQQSLFAGLTGHPRYQHPDTPAFIRTESCQDDHEASDKLAEVLSNASPGRQQPVTCEQLVSSNVRIDFVTGGKDTKFVKIANALASGMRKQSGGLSTVSTHVVPNSGHAVHLEAPEGLVLPLLRCIRENAKVSREE